MQKGLIAVTAVNSTDGLPSSYSNKRGIVQNWCIAAVGDYNFNVRNVTGVGTSFAAPAVTGTAALVREKYPWMNGDPIRQTILSTVTDKGVNSIWIGTSNLRVTALKDAENIPVFLKTEVTCGNNGVKLSIARRDIAEYADSLTRLI